jgi:glycosyltransferase involved in cell wall biosynthesis
MIKIVSCFWNAKNYLKTYIDSIKIQNFKDFEVFLIDDVSTDNGSDLVKELIHNDDRFKLIENTEKKFKLRNLDELISNFDDEDIVVEVDADDFLLGNDVLSLINKIYSDGNTWLTNGSFMYSNGIQGFSQKCNPDTIRTDDFRFSHLRTWKSFLWKNIPKENFLDNNGDYYKSGADVAYSFPLLELCGEKHYKFINKVLYVYNETSPYNDHKTRSAAGGVNVQSKCANEIRIKSKLNLLRL